MCLCLGCVAGLGAHGYLHIHIYISLSLSLSIYLAVFSSIFAISDFDSFFIVALKLIGCVYGGDPNVLQS